MGPGRRDEVEAAYFTLLRAREKVTALHRYEEFLRDERRRLQRFVAEGDALDAHVDPRFRRALNHTDTAVAEALKTRHEVIDLELDRLPDRIAGAEAFVEEAEEEHDRLRQG